MILKQAKRLIVFVVGATVVLLGVIMLVTPGQGVLTILAGLAILATEFVWARHLLKRVREQAGQAVRRIRGDAPSPEEPPLPDDNNDDGKR
ncbi:MAG: putative rane protein of unknown function [Candidatus Hydrogenedentota bacterium]